MIANKHPLNIGGIHEKYDSCDVGGVTHKPETEEAPLDALDGWKSGLVPMPAVAMIGAIKRSTGMTQEAMAQRIGLSRPHLANALQGRFGLAPDIVSRFKAFLREPPPLLQPRLI